MNLKSRLMNTYRTGGIYEIIRKCFFHIIYSLNNKKTLKKINSHPCEYGLNIDSKRQHKVIVSLTSFPKRFNHIGLCLKSLLLQKFKPDRIIVYLGSDSSENDITSEMREFEKYGIEYRLDKTKNLKSHKKYFYAMQEFPTSIIVTADDDLIYPSDWLESLVFSYKHYPNCISARRVHKMRIDGSGKLYPYNFWIDQYRKEKKPSACLFPTTGFGTLFPPNSISKYAFDIKKIENDCFEADDVWLKCMSILADTKVVWVKSYEVDLGDTGNGDILSLSSNNVINNYNDVFLERVLKDYNIDPKVFFI